MPTAVIDGLESRFEVLGASGPAIEMAANLHSFPVVTILRGSVSTQLR